MLTFFLSSEQLNDVAAEPGNDAALVKARAKRSRWGPEQLTATPPSQLGRTLPASGFKGVHSHHPPGVPLPAKSAKVIAKQAEGHSAALELGSPDLRPQHASLISCQPAAQPSRNVDSCSREDSPGVSHAQQGDKVKGSANLEPDRY